MLSCDHIGANDSCVFARHICSCTSVTWTNYERNSLTAVNEITTSKQQYVWATFTNDPDRMCELNWLQQNLLRSAIGGVLRPSSV